MKIFRNYQNDVAKRVFNNMSINFCLKVHTGHCFFVISLVESNLVLSYMWEMTCKYDPVKIFLSIGLAM